MSADCKDGSESLVFILIEGVGDELFGIRMVPKPEVGGARMGTGPAVPISQETIRQEGCRAFQVLEDVSPDSELNTDMAPGGKFSKSKVLHIQLEAGQVIITRIHRRGRQARSEERACLGLQVDGEALLESLRAALK